MIYLVKVNNLICLFVPCDQFVNVIFDSQTVFWKVKVFIGQQKCLLVGDQPIRVQFTFMLGLS